MVNKQRVGCGNNFKDVIVVKEGWDLVRTEGC